MSQPTLSIITTCKARLAHLRQSLPAMVAQHGAQVIVVDYGCPEGTVDWVQQAHPGVQVVQVRDDPGFNLARARNLGAAQARADWLAFLDADTIPGPDFGAQISRLLTPNAYFLGRPSRFDTWGSCVAPAAAWRAIGGYDEVIRGYGGEDNDFYDRLHERGVRRAWFPIEWLTTLPHSDEERTRFHPDQDVNLAMQVNHLYRTIKQDIRRSTGSEPALENRKQLHALARQAVLKSVTQAATLVIELPLRHLKTRPPRPVSEQPSVATVLRYTVSPRKLRNPS